MYTKFTRKLLLPVVLFVTAFTMLFSSLAPAATVKRKLQKTWKEYDENNNQILIYQWKYDSKGNTTWSYTHQVFDGNTYTDTQTYKLTYWKGTSLLKKVVEKGSEYTSTITYTKKGGLKQSITQRTDGGGSKTTYTSSGKKVRKSVSFDEAGRKFSEAIYDKRGNLKQYTYYGFDGHVSKTTYSNSYYPNGKLKKRTLKNEDQTAVSNFDKKGNVTKTVRTYTDGRKVTEIYKNTYSKDGYLTKQQMYQDGKLKYTDKYTYTSKLYSVDE